ncbi:GNAT family N-acetyltransferase [Streptomyces sp. NPDC051322]|uniref:GNAT family N-acetyltransferase n=1 Tax=Streptomyces sp. NPDC051322 TaxID=3154645 RepID=UPI00344B5623
MSDHDPYTRPEIHGLGLSLRPWEPADADVLLRGFTDPELLRWNTPRRPIADLSDARAAIRARAEGLGRRELAQFAVTESGTIVGSVGLSGINHHMRRAAVGYWILPEHRHRSLATCALELCTRWAFEQGGLHRIELGHAVEHIASCRVAERCGYLVEGTKRDGMHEAQRTEAFRDQHLHARLSTDPPPALGESYGQSSSRTQPPPPARR